MASQAEGVINGGTRMIDDTVNVAGYRSATDY